MNKRQRQLVRESFANLRDSAGPLAMLFYGRLFSLDPKLRSMFPEDLREQGRKLMATLEAAIESLDNFEALRPRLRELGLKHAELGVQPAHYELVSSALLWAIGMGLEHGFQPEVKQAWREVIVRISAEMQAGAVER